MSLPPIELIKDTHTFPGSYTFKVIGAKDPFFASRLASVVKEELKWELAPEYSVRDSESGKHQSVTLELTMQTAEEVHVVYQKLSATPGVLLLL